MTSRPGRGAARGGGRRVAFFVSPHGFGHAARACAVAAALRDLLSARGEEFRPCFFTAVPGRFFGSSLDFPYDVVFSDNDVGLVQVTPLEEDVAATVGRLDEMLPWPEAVVSAAASDLAASGAEAVVCDVSALGVLAAARAGLPSVLVENFLWDWIYAAYPEGGDALSRHSAYLAAVYSGADFRIRTEPWCGPKVSGAEHVGLVSRLPRTPRAEARKGLGLRPDETAVLVTLGGTPAGSRAWSGRPAGSPAGTVLLVPDTGVSSPLRRDGVVLVPASLYHPDVVGASDCVVGKLGYGTVAEVVACGVPFVYSGRPRFPESPWLARYVEAFGRGVPVTPEELLGGRWEGAVTEALDRSPGPARPPASSAPVARTSGAAEAAAVIAGRYFTPRS